MAKKMSPPVEASALYRFVAITKTDYQALVDRKMELARTVHQLSELRDELHKFFNETTNPPEAERRLREILYS